MIISHPDDKCGSIFFKEQLSMWAYQNHGLDLPAVSSPSSPNNSHALGLMSDGHQLMLSQHQAIHISWDGLYQLVSSRSRNHAALLPLDPWRRPLWWPGSWLFWLPPTSCLVTCPLVLAGKRAVFALGRGKLYVYHLLSGILFRACTCQNSSDRGRVKNIDIYS